MQSKLISPHVYTLGLDIGVASVGWCVLGEQRIIDLGVRAFDKAETAKEGDSLNLVRRSARLMRRRLRRRAWRQIKLARLLKRVGLIDAHSALHKQQPHAMTPWQLRVAGLDRLLTTEEWARVIYHLCKHRGFHWVSRAEEKQAAADGTGEGGKVKKGLAGTARLMQEKGYRTVAEMVLTEFPEAQRNKAGDYGKSLSRVLLAEEFHRLFVQQRALGNPHADTALETAILGQGDRKSGIFWLQKPPLAGADLLKMLGKCTFEKTEYRAPKASFTAERHVWLTRLNNLRIIVEGEARPLNETERRVALPLPYTQASELTYKHLHTALVKAGLLPESFEFAGLRATKEGKDPLAEKLIKIPAWQELRTTLKKAGLETEWQGMAGAAMDGNPQLLDDIAWILSVYKDDSEVENELRKLTLPNPEKMRDALLDIRFDKFHALSLKALRQIVPHMESGLRYDEACLRAGYHHSQLYEAGSGEHKYLPPFYAKRDKDGRMVFRDDMDVPRNPVVLRSLNQARKVVNAVIRRYGAPMAVHIEMARDLAKPLVGHPKKDGGYVEGRRDIEKEQAEYRDRNEKDKGMFAEQFGQPPKGPEFEKWRLYREQQGKCAYSLTALDIHRLLEPGYVEIDHALPYSRSYDNGKNNKVLVLVKENRDKGNRTAYEYLTAFPGGEDGERWRAFVAWVESNKSYRLAKRSRLLRKNFGADDARDFKERNLNDTRYICRFFKNYVERHLKLADDSEAKRCVVVNGQLTAFLRARWGLIKVRSENDRHHALDAAVVATCSHGMVKRLADYARRKELEKVRAGFVDMETGEIVDPTIYARLQQHFPEPWPHFRGELEARLNIDDVAELRERMSMLGSYSTEAIGQLRPLFVSRAVQRRSSGAIHEATIRSAKQINNNVSHVKVPLTKLKESDLPNIVGAADSRNAGLLALLRERLKFHGGNAKKAFAVPVFKPAKNGLGPLVRSVKLEATQKTGLLVRGGVAELGEMHHVDVYRVAGLYHVEPAYEARTESRINTVPLPPNAEFLFSLTKNDFVKVRLNGVIHEGYFTMYESDGRMTLRQHDQPQPDKKHFRKVVKSAESIQKFHVDVLGSLYPASKESPRGLA